MPASALLTISIHALTRSATADSAEQELSEYKFQSTHSQGVRLKCLIVFLHQWHFNPCTHKECDLTCHEVIVFFAFISIHALTRSATVVNVPSQGGLFISIHALTRSATSFRLKAPSPPNISIHALTRSATFNALHLYHLHHYFNPRTHKECDSYHDW